MLIFLLSPVHADDAVTYLNKGVATPSEGYLFTPEAEKNARLGIIERDFYKALNDTKDKQLDLMKDNNKIYEERIANASKQNDVLASKLQESTSSNKIETALYFLGGAVITGAVSYGIYTSSVWMKK